MRQKIFYNTIKNEKGEPQEVILNEKESKQATYLERVANALGFDIAITTLTQIAKRITEQKFYRIAPAEFVPVRIGNGAWDESILTYRDMEMGDQFETGIVQLAADNSRLASADAGVDSISIPIFNWIKQSTWSLPQLEQASKAGNWSVVEAKMRARKRNWDLGVQRAAFLGLNGMNTAGLAANKQVLGLLNQDLSTLYGSQVTVDTTTITQTIGSLVSSPTNLNTLITALLQKYQANCSYTTMPTHFAIPQDDFLSLAGMSSPSFPLKSVLTLMREIFAEQTENPNFVIRGLAYAMPAYNNFNQHLYALYNYDEESIRMDIPVDYTNTLANSMNNIQFQSAAYGQLTGVGVYRPAELYYFRF